MKRRLLHLLIALDQLVFVVITLGRARPDETMSAAAWRLDQRGRLAGRIFRPLIDHIFWFDPDHCRNSYMNEVNGSHLPNGVRQ